MSINVVLGAAAFLVACAVYLYSGFSRRNQLPHPPGVRGWPVVGHLTMPEGPLWKVYRHWGEMYGSDVVRINVLGTNIIVTNTLEASTDLLDKRSSVYSDRPSYGMTMMVDLCGFDWSVALMRYGATWRDARKAFQQEFHPQVIRRYQAIETTAAYEFARNALQTPHQLFAHIRHAYGVDVRESGDPIIATAEHGLEAAVAAMNPGQFLVDVIPLLKYVPEWFPGAGFQKQARIWRVSVDRMLHVPFNLSKGLLASNALPEDCAARNMLNDIIPNASDPAYMEFVVRATLGTMYAAGTDTTVSTMQSFFLAMVLHPEVQKKAQQSIDRVCHGRLPEFSDFHSLPYVHAVLKEVLRWHPVIPLNLAHVSTKDDVYNGYFIPKGSFVLANTWAILHDPDVYTDPETFNPDRFLRTNDAGELELDPTVRDPDVAAFGFGRRICPGRFMAYEAMWIAVASVLATLDIRKARDEQGAEVIPEEAYSSGFMIFPQPFTCDIRARSAEHGSLVMATMGREV